MTTGVNTGTLYLLPADFGEGTETQSFISESVRDIAARTSYFVVENERSARRYLRRIGFSRPFEETVMKVLNVNTPGAEISFLLTPALEGNDIAVLSEAGMPCIADPGSELVLMAHQKKIPVVPLPGPSSIMMAIAASGLNGQRFTFTGYLPIDRDERKEAIRLHEKSSRASGTAVFLIETPYRSKALLADLISTVNPETLLSVSCNIGIKGGWSRTHTAMQWSRQTPDLNKSLCVFGLQASRSARK